MPSISKLRPGPRSVDASQISLDSGSGDGDGSSESQHGGGSGLRSSIDKVRQRTRRSIDDRRGSADAGRRLSKLIPKRRCGDKTGNAGLEQTNSLGAFSVEAGGRNLSVNSLLDDSGHSSLLTDDNSDVERKPVRPTFSPHQSHAGLLTLSSPELHTQKPPVATVDDLASSPALQPVDSVPHIVEPDDTLPFPPLEAPRSTALTPAEKFRSAFNLSRKPPTSDTDSTKSASGGGGLGALLRPKSRRGSVASQVSQEPPKDELVSSASDPEISVPEQSALALAKLQSADGNTRPVTPQASTAPDSQPPPSTPPNLVETPTTYVTPPTPTDLSFNTQVFPARNAATSQPTDQSPPSARPLNSVESIRHRRAQSAKLPSKLSNAVPAPLTPTVEETKTPGGTLTQPTSATGFFSSFLTAATKAADQLSQNINTQTKSKAVAGSVAASEENSKDIIASGEQKSPPLIETTRPAAKSLGKGDVGIAASQDTSPMTSAVDLPQLAPAVTNDVSSQRTEEEAAARAVSVAYEKPVQKVISQATGRPLSVASNERLTLNGEQSPTRHGDGAADGGIKRSGSVRSKISGKTRRHRASSATTGTTNTIAAGLQASMSTLANPATGGPGHRLTGFAVASSKRNKDFHQLFRSVPEDDYLIEDYSAALQRDILLHGRLYVSEAHICFSSNILGWVTNLVMSFDEIVSVEKKSTAMIFPNAIVVQTQQARNTFASLVARDSTYELIIGIWKISHPNLKSSLNGVALADASTGDKTEVAEPEGSEGESADGSDDEVYDEDDDDDVGSFTDAGMAPSAAASDAGDLALNRKTSAQPVSGAPLLNGTQSKMTEASPEAVSTGIASSGDFPGPAAHAPTDCGDGVEHYDRPLTDTTIPAPLGKVYSMMFGPASGAFMRKWLVEDQKSRELNLTDDKIGLDNDHKSVVFDYIKPLNAPVGPRQTKCITTNTLITMDLEKAVTVDCSTQTPDVPSGNVFTTKTRYCLMWAPGNSTRIIANCTIEWTGKSWLKGPIEKGANDGQIEYLKSLTAALKAAVATKAVAKGPLKKGKRRSKKDAVDADTTSAQPVPVMPEQKRSDWGMLEPLHAILQPLLALLRPFIKSEVIIAVLFALLLYTWLVPPRGNAIGYPATRPDRIAAYNEMWQREESELWDWLEDRIGLNNLYAPSTERKDRQRVLASRGMAKKLESERMSDRQIDDAIKITEERLGALKIAVARNKGAIREASGKAER